MITGILLGFGAATSNSVAYLFSRAFIQKHHQSYFQFLAISHIMIGALGLITAIIFRPEQMPSFSAYGPPLLGASLFYFGAQACLFLALKRAEASRLSPMLGSKIIILSLISVTFLDKSFTSVQWIAIIFSFTAAILLTRAGSRVPASAIAFIAMTCLGYSLSDINIANLIDSFETGMPTLKASVFSASLCYIVCATVSLAMLPLLPGINRTMWKDAMPFSILWFIALICLFGCFAIIGIIYGNIIQSTRGIISVVIAAFISRMGFQQLEQKVDKWVLIRRIFAAALMTAAIALFQMNSTPQ